LVCDRLGTEPAEYGNSRGCHNRLAVSRVAATLPIITRKIVTLSITTLP
jgi:hypothetical protein